MEQTVPDFQRKFFKIQGSTIREEPRDGAKIAALGAPGSAWGTQSLAIALSSQTTIIPEFPARLGSGNGVR